MERRWKSIRNGDINFAKIKGAKRVISTSLCSSRVKTPIPAIPEEDEEDRSRFSSRNFRVCIFERYLERFCDVFAEISAGKRKTRRGSGKMAERTWGQVRWQGWYDLGHGALGIDRESFTQHRGALRNKSERLIRWRPPLHLAPTDRFSPAPGILREIWSYTRNRYSTFAHSSRGPNSPLRTVKKVKWNAIFLRDLRYLWKIGGSFERKRNSREEDTVIRIVVWFFLEF